MGYVKRGIESRQSVEININSTAIKPVNADAVTNDGSSTAYLKRAEDGGNFIFALNVLS